MDGAAGLLLPEYSRFPSANGRENQEEGLRKRSHRLRKPAEARNKGSVIPYFSAPKHNEHLILAGSRHYKGSPLIHK